MASQRTMMAAAGVEWRTVRARAPQGCSAMLRSMRAAKTAHFWRQALQRLLAKSRTDPHPTMERTTCPAYAEAQPARPTVTEMAQGWSATPHPALAHDRI